MGKNYSRKHFLWANIHWSFDVTGDLQLATNSAAGLDVIQVIWPLSLNSLLSCGYLNMGKINFFPIFPVHFRGHVQLSPAFIFHCLYRIPRTLYGWNFVFGTQLLHHLTVMWNIEQIQIFHTLLHFQAWISQSIWLTDPPNFLCSASAMLAVREYKFLLFIWPTAHVLTVWNVKNQNWENILCAFSHTLYNTLTIHTVV